MTSLFTKRSNSETASKKNPSSAPQGSSKQAPELLTIRESDPRISNLNNYETNEEALVASASEGNILGIIWLVQQGTNIHYNDEQALVRTCANDYNKIAEFLLQNGADPHAQKNEAFFTAVRKNQIKIIKLLLVYAYSSSLDSWFDKLMELCAIKGHDKIMELLIKYRKKFYVPCRSEKERNVYERCFIEAVQNNKYQVLHVLKEHIRLDFILNDSHEIADRNNNEDITYFLNGLPIRY